ncbi:MAG: uracil-DNA glycosylase [Chloroflexi bacterium]|nr:uracil-DNA glycosylase [Chloroflexota bacterium]
MTSDKSRRLVEIEREVERSQACRSGGGDTPVFGSGNPDSGVVILGEGPGAQEEREGRPFVGASGQLLRKALASLGFQPDRDFFFLNAVWYRSFKLGKDGRRENKPPSVTQIEGCRPFLERSLEVVDPALIISLGTRPAKWLFGPSFKLSEGHGRLREWGGIKVLPTYHPAAALRPFGVEGAERKRRFEEDLATAARIIREMGDFRVTA